MSIFAVYGGSFDPPHNGHTNVLNLIMEQEFFDGVIVVPAGGNPFKELVTLHSDRKKILLKWVHGVAEELGAEKIRTNHWIFNQKNLILDLESLQLNETSTFRTVERLSECRLADDLVIVIGSDLVEEVPRWQFADQLIDRYCFAVIPRGGFQRVFPCGFREIPLELTNFEPTEISSTIINNKKLLL